MKKRIVTIIMLAVTVLSLTACGSKKEDKNHIVDNQPNAAATVATDSTTAPAEDATPNPTFAPVATAAPDAAQKAEDKISDGGSANATISENGETRKVDLKFTLVNETGVNFYAMLIEPVTADLTKGSNRFPADFVFENGMSIELTPPTAEGNNGYVLDTTLFNIAAVDAEGRGFVFQNIDLASSKSITLLLEDGVPKAVIN